MTQRTSRHKKLMTVLFACVIGMFGFAFALVPLYDVLCDALGINGKTGRTTVNETLAMAQTAVETKAVGVRFTGAVGNGFPVRFAPKNAVVHVEPGRLYTAEYVAENTTDTPMMGRAIPSLAPGQAALYFKKLDCFCFSAQQLPPHEPVVMSVRFVVDPDIPKDMTELTLSYTFFKEEQS